MSAKPPQPPNSVPEEDLNLHEDFSPIIAENGLIRQPKAPEVSPESLPAFLTQLDTLQDLVQLRHAEEAQQQGTPDGKESPGPDTGANKNFVSFPLEGEDARRADEGESNIKNNPMTAKVPPHPAQVPPSPSGRGEQVSFPLEGEDVRRTDERESKTKGELPLNEDKSPAATTTFLTVRQAQTTALVPVTKLTLARRITLLKRKRQHARRLKARQKLRLKSAAQQEQIRQAVGPQGTGAVPPQQTATPLTRARRRWPWVLAVLLFLFLGGISGLVPVEKIPFLRELAYAMGFDKTDTSRMSFLRALLTWTDKTIGLPGNWSGDESGTSLWARGGNMLDAANPAAQPGENTSGWNAGLARQGGQTSLIDIQALNALQRKKGYALDGVRGAVKLTPGQEEAEVGPAVLRDAQVNVRTEANRDKSEVFFGSDNSAINRNFQDGYDSSKVLAKVKNPHIADGVPIDWLSNMTKRMMKSDTALGGINREVNSTQVAWGDGIADVGDKKEHRDLYHAWITSRMSKYTPNVMLKKGLADSSFLGADIPTMASNVLGFSGIQVDLGAMQEDESAWQEYLEWEKNCREEIQERAGKNVSKAEESFRSVIKGNNFDIPNCYEMVASGYSAPTGKFKESAKNVAGICDTLDKGYKTLNETCNMKFFPNEIKCDTLAATYEKRWTDYYGDCVSAYQADKKDWEDKWSNEHPDEPAPADPYFLNNVWKPQGTSKTEETVRGNTTLAEVTSNGRQFATWIKATCDADDGHCTPIDMQPSGYSESVENVKGTIRAGITPIR